MKISYLISLHVYESEKFHFYNRPAFVGLLPHNTDTYRVHFTPSVRSQKKQKLLSCTALTNGFS
jgi:hypothetical protein